MKAIHALQTSKLFYEGACGSLSAGSQTRQLSTSSIQSRPCVAGTARFRWLARSLCCGLLASLCSAPVSANPMGEKIQAGMAQFDRTGSQLTVHQQSDKAIIHWQDFSIAAGETTQFVQPSSSSAVLNRVTGGNLSEIMGTLNANGQVFLINPNGIVIGKDGVINTQSFIGSTLDVSDAQFLNSDDLILSGDSNATIINLGTNQSAWWRCVSPGTQG